MTPDSTERRRLVPRRPAWPRDPSREAREAARRLGEILDRHGRGARNRYYQYLASLPPDVRNQARRLAPKPMKRDGLGPGHFLAGPGYREVEEADLSAGREL